MKKILECGIVMALLFGGRGEAQVEEPYPLHSERGGIGLEEVSPVSAPAVAVDPRRSLAVTDKAILSQFTLTAVMNQLTTQNGGTGLTSAQLFRQLWDTQNPSPGQPDLPNLPHCSDNGNALNGFPYPCRKEAEGIQALSTSSVTMSNYIAVGLFNRFDLKNHLGSNCGEYRLVFAKQSGITNPLDRLFIIFEGVLPNPQPGLGREGCRPVAQFWANLSTDNDVNSRATKLKDFYFKGLPGFRPIIHMNSYGNGTSGLGQVRTNQFMGQPWLLREFKLMRVCPTTTTCTLKFVPVTVKTNPAGSLFNPTNTSTLAKEFQAHLVTQVKLLANKNVNLFHYSVPNKFNMGQSDAQTATSKDDSYVDQFNAAATSTFHSNVQTELQRIGSTLTPKDIVARAQAQSCGGCHQRSKGAAMGGFGFPSSSNFVHSSEGDDPADPTRFLLSPALVSTFLPHRKTVLENFLHSPVTGAAVSSQSVPLTATPGQTLGVTITMINRGTLSWSTANGIALIPVSSHKWGITKRDVGTTLVHKTHAKTFSFSVVAPTVPGTYSFQWRMARNGTGFGDSTPLVNVTVK